MAASGFPFCFASIALLFWTLVLFPRTAANPVQETSDAAVPYSALVSIANTLSQAFSLYFTEHEAQCLDMRQVLYDGACYRLLERGPCNNTEWLVVDKQEALNGSGALVAVCRPRSCPPGYAHVTSHGKCYHLSDIHNILCNYRDGVSYLPDIFGEYHCLCSDSSGRLLGSADETCYPWYTRGPCGAGSVLVPVIDLLNFGFGTCRPDQCLGYVSQYNSGFVSVLMDTGEAWCYNVGTRGPCPQGHFLRTLPVMNSVQCIFEYSFFGAAGGGSAGAISVETVSEECFPTNNGTCAKLTYPPLKLYSSNSEFG